MIALKILMGGLLVFIAASMIQLFVAHARGVRAFSRLKKSEQLHGPEYSWSAALTRRSAARQAVERSPSDDRDHLLKLIALWRSLALRMTVAWVTLVVLGMIATR